MSQTHAERLFNDTRTKKAIEQLVDNLREHQASLTDVRPPQKDLKNSYRDIVDRVEDLRGRGLYYPYLSSGLGNGTFVELADGSVKYDFIIGIGVHYLGHSNPDLTRVVLKAALEDTVMQGNLQQNPDSVGLMDDFRSLANRNNAGFDHCFLTSSGAMANENALKMLFHQQPEADRLLAFEGGFSGRSMALAEATDKPKYRKGLPDTLTVDHVPFVGKHRSQKENQRALGQLESLLEEHGDRYAGMILEVVQGEGGFYPADPEVLDVLLERLNQHDVPVLADEIQSFGRTPEPFAFQHYGIDHHIDVVTVGKLSQTCATIYREEFNPDPGLISQTFTSSTTAIKASRHILNHLGNNDYFGNDGRINKIHNTALKAIEDIKQRHPEWIHGPHGIGTMVAFQVMDGTKAVTERFLNRLFENGVIGFPAGENPTRVRFLLPAGAVTDQQIDDAFNIVEDTLNDVAEQS